MCISLTRKSSTGAKSKAKDSAIAESNCKNQCVLNVTKNFFEVGRYTCLCLTRAQFRVVNSESKYEKGLTSRICCIVQIALNSNYRGELECTNFSV